MDEFAITNVDAHMAEGFFHRVEEHEVARLEFVAVNLFGGLGLLGRPAGQHQAERLLVQVAHKAAAIEAGFLAGAATAVGHTQQTHGLGQHVGGFFAEGLTCLRKLAGQ